MTEFVAVVAELANQPVLPELGSCSAGFVDWPDWPAMSNIEFVAHRHPLVVAGRSQRNRSRP